MNTGTKCVANPAIPEEALIYPLEKPLVARGFQELDVTPNLPKDAKSQMLVRNYFIAIAQRLVETIDLMLDVHPWLAKATCTHCRYTTTGDLNGLHMAVWYAPELPHVAHAQARVVQMLLQKGVDPLTKNTNGETPADLCEKRTGHVLPSQMAGAQKILFEAEAKARIGRIERYTKMTGPLSPLVRVFTSKRREQLRILAGLPAPVKRGASAKAKN